MSGRKATIAPHIVPLLEGHPARIKGLLFLLQVQGVDLHRPSSLDEVTRQYCQSRELSWPKFSTTLRNRIRDVVNFKTSRMDTIDPLSPEA